MTRTEYDVVALGELLIDFTAQGAGADGYPLMAAHPGGAPANFLAAIARLGGRTALLSKVGADAFGIFMLRQSFKQIPDEIVESAKLDGVLQAAEKGKL